MLLISSMYLVSRCQAMGMSSARVSRWRRHTGWLSAFWERGRERWERRGSRGKEGRKGEGGEGVSVYCKPIIKCKCMKYCVLLL